MKKQESRTDEDEDNIVLSVSMPKNMKKNLKMYALEKDTNVSQLLRQIIRESIPEYNVKEKQK